MPTAVLIVNYRTYGDLARCLASVTPHLRSSDEIVVVDYECDLVAMDNAKLAFVIRPDKYIGYRGRPVDVDRLLADLARRLPAASRIT